MRFSKALLIGLSVSLVPAMGYAADDGAEWSYEGDTGPEHWAKLVADNAACAGSQQSPINLTDAYEADVENISTSWSAFTPAVLNNGHTIQVNAPDDQTTTFGDKTYNFLQVHWHHTSEHTIDGERSPMETHFVHEEPESGALMVLGVMLVPGEANATFQSILDLAPSEEGENQGDGEIDLTEMLPENGTVYRYAGSLTTPPCSEIVNWVVYKDPIEVSQEQIDAFAAIYPSNNRPLQEQGRRLVLVGE